VDEALAARHDRAVRHAPILGDVHRERALGERVVAAGGALLGDELGGDEGKAERDDGQVLRRQCEVEIKGARSGVVDAEEFVRRVDGRNHAVRAGNKRDIRQIPRVRARQRRRLTEDEGATDK